MKHKFLLSGLLSLFLLSACNSEQLEFNNSVDTPLSNIPGKSYTIPIDSALSYLNSYLNDTNNGTRSSERRKIKDVKPIRMSKFHNKLTRGSSEGDSILYVVNFENDEGYAFLAADSRIDENVVAIIDEGSVNDSIVNEALALMNQERPYFEGYPTDGPGFFTTPETGDEVFINPNTVSFYFPEEDDMLIGNYTPDSEAQTEYTEDVPSLDPVNDTDGATMATIICMNYAMEQIDNNQEIVEYEPSPTPEGQPGWWDNYPGEQVDEEYSPWSIKEEVYPILSQYCFWRQGKPFNNLCPTRRVAILFGGKRTADCGCFPLAISKIFTHFESPSIFTYNGYTVDWTELKSYYSLDSFSEKAEKSAAYLLRGIGDFCGSWYFYQGTFTFPKRAKSFMRTAGYQNAEIYRYSHDKVIDMLSNVKPLIIYGIPGINIFKAHSWNIDGYWIKERTLTKRIINNGHLVESFSLTEESEMIHCDFGWGGNSNGYYVSGVFGYNTYIHIITY